MNSYQMDADEMDAEQMDVSGAGTDTGFLSPEDLRGLFGQQAPKLVELCRAHSIPSDGLKHMLLFRLMVRNIGQEDRIDEGHAYLFKMSRNRLDKYASDMGMGDPETIAQAYKNKPVLLHEILRRLYHRLAVKTDDSDVDALSSWDEATDVCPPGYVQDFIREVNGRFPDWAGPNEASASGHAVGNIVQHAFRQASAASEYTGQTFPAFSAELNATFVSLDEHLASELTKLGVHEKEVQDKFPAVIQELKTLQGMALNAIHGQRTAITAHREAVSAGRRALTAHAAHVAAFREQVKENHETIQELSEEAKKGSA